MFEISEADYWATGFPGYEAYVRRPLTEKEKMHVEIYKTLNWSLLYGAQGYGKNMAAAEKVRERVARMRNGLYGSGSNGPSVWTEETAKMPQKVCNYRKPKVHWFGELHGSNNFVHNPSMQRSSHWTTARGKMQHLKLEEFFKQLGDDIETYQNASAMGTSTGRFANADPLKGKRFIGISEPTETNQFDQDFLKKFTGDDWVETRTLDVSSKSWEPQGEIFVMSGKPLKINDKSKGNN